MSEGDAKIIHLSDFRPPKSDKTVYRLTFVGSLMENQGGAASIKATVVLYGHEVLDAIRTIREAGGFWSAEVGGSRWYVPWPCAAVKLEPSSETELKAYKEAEARASQS